MSRAEMFLGGLKVTDSGCREWTGYTMPKMGYGRVRVSGRMTLTHRYAWMIAHGDIPPGVKVLHHCDNPPCCETNPTEGYPEGHLFLGTDAENSADRDAKGRNGFATRTHCPARHEYTEANTYVTPQGFRVCRMCQNASQARYAERQAS